jgi:P4 family phage/plasmid primase-like protien
MALEPSSPRLTLLDAALAYAAAGIPVFPLRRRAKDPYTQHGFKDASTNAAQIRSWWRRWPQANIGIPTGRASGWLVIDIDTKAGATYDQLAALGTLPATRIAQTGSGGLHLVFRYPTDQEIRNSASKLAAGVDVRGEGGYIVAAPSVTVVGQYDWTNELPPVDAPAWLLKRLSASAGYQEPLATGKRERAPRQRDDRDGYWLSRALERSGQGTGDTTGYWLAQQLLLDPGVRDIDGTLRAYARRATLDASDPFDDRSIARWLTSAQRSQLVVRGEPARNPRPAAARAPLRALPRPEEDDERADVPPTSLPPVTERRTYHRTEMGNAERLLDLYGERLRYTKAAGYVVWDGRRWRAGAELEVEHWAKLVIRGIYQEAAELAGAAAQVADDDKRQAASAEAQELMKWATASERAKMVSAMLMLARSACAVDLSVFDNEPWLFNCANGTIDLRTGELRAHRREDYLMQMSPVAYDPAAQCPTFLRFLDDILLGDQELVAYLQRVLGYTLTGHVTEQSWWLLLGEGENGKGTLMETFAALMGDYAHTMQPESITISGQPRRGGEASPDMAVLKGKRFVRITETQEGARIDAARIKMLSGGDTISARFLHKDIFEFRPTFKIFIYTNHRPESRETTHAFWRRVRYVPFDLDLKNHPERKDERLLFKLQSELPGILAWAVQGCLAWQREGLQPPARVLEATESYRAESDVLRDFLDAHCVVRWDQEVRANALYAAYVEWCKETGERPQNMRRFGKAITERGFTRKVSNGVVYVGIGLRSDVEQTTLTI